MATLSRRHLEYDPACKRRRGGNGTGISSTSAIPSGALSQSTAADAIISGRKRKTIASSLPSRRSPRLHSEQSAAGNNEEAQPESNTQSDQDTGQSPPPSQLAASQRPYRIQLSRAKRKLHGAGSRELGSFYFLQMLTAFLQFIGKQYSATGQDQVIFFETNDLVSTKDWKAVSAALDRNQPTTKL